MNVNMNPTDFGIPADFDSLQSDDDKKLFVVFHRGYEVNEAKSVEAGRPVHDDIDLCTIRVPGQRDSVVHKVDHSLKQRFPRQWAAYQANADQAGSGTILSELPWLTPAQVADLRAVNVRTVEQLADMPDSNAHVMMGFHGLKQRAQAYLDAAKGAAPMLKLQAELESRDAQIAQLQATVAELAQKVNKPAKASKPSAHEDLVG